jgi:Ca2+-binding RTX toxin-like protein
MTVARLLNVAASALTGANFNPNFDFGNYQYTYNITPTLTSFDTSVATGLEDNSITITFNDLLSHGNEADVDGTVNSFVIKTVTSGNLLIGSSAANAVAFNPTTNNTIDALHQAYWTPAANANGTFNAFTIVAKDNDYLESATPVQVSIDVTPVNDAPTGIVTISGTAILNQILTASNSLADVDGLGTITYQWLADGSAISGATTSTLTLTEAQVGKAITVQASYIDLQGTAESVTSSATTPISVPTTIPVVTITAGITPLEGAAGSFIVTLDSPAPAGGLTINYSMSGTATLNTDYTVTAGDNISGVTNGSFTIAEGQTTASLTINASGDDGYDPNETADISLQTGSGYSFVGNATTFASKVDFASGINPHSVSLGDFNGDGKVDLAVTNLSINTVSVLLRNATNTGFDPKVDFATGLEPRSVSIGDFNGDGKADLAVANLTSGTVSVLLRNAANTGFDPKVDFTTGSYPISVSVGDFNGDGKADLAVANLSSDTVSVLLRNAANTGFDPKVDLVTSRPFSVSAGDFNGDGKTDLVVSDAYSNHNTVSVLLRNAANTGFESQVYLAGSKQVSVGDFNGDGKVDIAVDNFYSDKISVLLRNATNTGFDPIVNVSTGSTPDLMDFTSVGDINGDGKTDLVVVNAISNTVSVILRNAANNGFDPKIDFITGSYPHSVSVGDVNGDGKVDLTVANFSDQTLSVLLNNTTPTASLTIIDNSSVNHAPELTGTPATLADGSEDNAYTVTLAELLQGYTDADNDVLSVVGLTSDNGVVIDNGLGGYTITPDANYFGPVTLYYGVSDGTETTPASLSYQLLSVNDAPELTNPAATLPEGVEDTPYVVSAADLLAGFIDVDNDVLSVVNLLCDNGTVLDNLDGTFTITPTANYNGLVNLYYGVSDGSAIIVPVVTTPVVDPTPPVVTPPVVTPILVLTPAIQSFSLMPVNDAPALTETAATLVDGLEDTLYSVSVSDLLTGFTDADGDGLSIVNLLADHGVVSDLGGGNYQINLEANYNGIVNLTYSVTDGSDETPATQIFTVIAVNDLPELTGTQAILADGTEGLAYTITSAELLQGFTDVDGDVLSVSDLTADFGVVTDNFNGTFTLIPAPHYSGPVSLSYAVSDGVDSLAATQSFVLVQSNYAPELISPLVDQAVKYNTPEWSYEAGSHFSDSDLDDVLTYTATLVDGSALPAWLVINSVTGLLSGSPALVDIASLLIAVTATDLDGANVSAVFTVAVTAFEAGQLFVSTPDNDSFTGDTTNDTVSYAYATAGVTVSLAVNTAQNTISDGLDTLIGIENLIGSQFNDRLTGNAGANTLFGGAGIDTLIGGGGNDTYIVNITAAGTLEDVVTAGAGLDTLQVFGNYAGAGATLTAAAAIENIDISATGSALLNITGNANANTLVGNDANNQLNGGTGADTLSGGLGDDTYTVDNIGDVLIEEADQGTDSVNSAISFILAADFENLTLTGLAAINGAGNSGANVITGNASINTLDDGGIGASDTLIGGAGNDIYIVNNSGDSITELAAGGTDLIRSAVSFDLVNAANTENLTLTGTTDINGAGAAGANVITGNSGNNILTGGAGIDTLIGGGGNDTFVVNITTTGTLEDTLTAGAGIDTINVAGTYTGAAATLISAATIENYDISGTGTALLNVTGNVLSNRLTGNAANNVISDGGIGGLGDTLVGGLGNDTYTVTNSTDTVIELTAEGTDLVNSAVSFNLLTNGVNVENITLTGAAVINATGNDLNNTLTGNTGINTLAGGKGDDTYFVQTVGDIVNEALNEGRDLINSRIAYVLGANLEDLTLTGTLSINGTGNSLANVITGNTGANTLDDGGIGAADTLIGGAGNDTYLVNNTGDSITEQTGTAAGATDLIRSTVSFDLNNAANVENLTLIGVANLNAVGNSGINTLTGNTGNNVLTGGAGADVLVGGGGNDTYLVNITAAGLLEDTVTGNTGIDTIQVLGTSTNAAVTILTAAATIENYNISGTGSSLLNLTGNALANTLTGNAANNGLNGGTGADTLIGGAGNDTYTVDNASDIVTENAAQGTDLVNSSVTYTLAVNVENLTLTGTTAINATGNSGDNTLTGNSAINTLLGNDGNDILIGKAGNDTLTGGLGTDTFWFDTATNATTNKDTITDFVSGTDKLQFSVSVLSALGATGQFIANDQRFWSSANGLAHDASDRLIYNTATGALSYDSNGNVAGGAVIIEVLGTATHPALVATDMWVA